MTAVICFGIGFVTGAVVLMTIAVIMGGDE